MRLKVNIFSIVPTLCLFLALPVQKLFARELVIRAIGDIQSDNKALDEILTVSGTIDSKGVIQSNLHLVFLGDLIGGGPDSPAVIQRVMELQRTAPLKNSEVVILAGNHEINLLNNRYQYIAKEDQERWNQWLSPDDYWKEALFNALKIPAAGNSAAQILRDFYRSLVPWHQINGKLFVHSGISERMLQGIGSSLVADFQNKIKSILNGQSTLKADDWMFNKDGPTLTSQTADPLLAEFALDPPHTEATLDHFMSENNLDQIVVGHWATTGEIKQHSLIGDRIIHLDTGISTTKGQASYVDFPAGGAYRPHVWSKGKNLTSKLSSCLKALQNQ